jgi:hypothetical protein
LADIERGGRFRLRHRHCRCAAIDNHTDRAAFAKAEQAKRIVAALRAALPDYDPDGDGDNDAQEALTLITAAMDLLGDAAAALNGTDDDAEGGESDAMPGMMIARAQAAAPDDNATPVYAGLDLSAADDGAALVLIDEAAEAAKAVAHAARLRRLQLARIDVV